MVIKFITDALKRVPAILGMSASVSQELRKGPFLMVLTGAGISAQSGIPTFRDQGGLWSDYDDPELASLRGWLTRPVECAEFYDKRRAAILAAQPNEAHAAVARLQASWPGPLLLVTTNVDTLHEQAGAARVQHIHGTFSSMCCRTEGCAVVWAAEGSLLDTPCPSCGSRGPHRPDVVMFREAPRCMDLVFEAVDRCEIFVAIGCGAKVHPANLLPGMAARNHLRDRRMGAVPCRVIEANLKPTKDEAFSEVVQGHASEIVPSLVDRLLKEQGIAT